MNKFLIKSIFIVVLLGTIREQVHAQNKQFSLDDCISYALENSTDLGRANNEMLSKSSSLEQNKAARGPDLILSGSETLGSYNSYLDSNPGDGWDRNNNANLNLSLNSSLTIYNGARLKNAIIQGRSNLAASESDIQTQQEIISLQVLSAYINVMLSKEQLKNSKSLLEATEKQLEQATAKKEVGVLSPSDFLNIKSQYATDKAAQVSSQSDLRISMVSLMQIMNMPVSNAFDIEAPNTQDLLLSETETDAAMVYKVALGLQPGIKTAEYDLESAETGIKLAKSDALPVLSLQGSLNTWYNNNQSNIYLGEQIARQINPSLGLTLSIPIYQRKQVKNNVKQAVIEYENYQYKVVDIQNDLRKAIEQACTDAQTTESMFRSNLEQFAAEQESYRLAEEMFSTGLINSVDYLTSKNNLSTAENKLTQSKYSVILQNRIINYYMGSTVKF